jgi:hypothetical protein
MTRQAPGFLDAIEDLQRGLSRVRARSMVIGGVAVIAYGVPRLEDDERLRQFDSLVRRLP